MRFVIPPNDILLIKNYHWYSDNVREIDAWSLKTFGYQPREGMVLTFKSSKDRMLFLLRWES